MVQLSANASEANLFRAHAAPQGLCDNLINASKLLPSQQKGGVSLIQSIVTGLHERSRRGSMDGLRSFIDADNRSAADLGGLRRGTQSLHVKKPQFSEAFSGAVIREGADEPTLRVEDVGAQRAFIDTKYMELKRWTRPLVDADWDAFCRATKESKERNGKLCTITTESCTRRPEPRSRVRVKTRKPFGQRKRRGTATWNFTIQLANKINSRQNQSPSGTMGRTPSRSGGGTGEGVGLLGSCILMLTFGFTDRRRRGLSFSVAVSVAGAEILQKMWEGPCWEGVWPFLDPWDVVGLRTAASVWNVPGMYGPHGELFFFVIKKDPFALTRTVEFRPFCSCGDTEGMCFDWSAPDGSRKRLLCQVVASLLI